MTVRRFLDISTAHVSPAARHWLEANAWANAMQAREAGDSFRVAAFETGWIMYAPEFGNHERVHPDLVMPVVHARNAGCEYVCFDADATEVDGLATYEEDAASDEGLTDEEKAALALADRDIGEEVARLAAQEDAGIADELAEPEELDGATPVKRGLVKFDPPASFTAFYGPVLPGFPGRLDEAKKAAAALIEAMREAIHVHIYDEQNDEIPEDEAYGKACDRLEKAMAAL